MGRKHTANAKRKISDVNKGNKHALGYRHTEEAKQKIAEAGKRRRGRRHTQETLKKMSGKNSVNWKGGISFGKYCVKFNYKFKEQIRDKFGRVCFLCGKSEEENGVKLSVHHVSYDKDCLCSEIECEFVPLCMSCHSKTHNNRSYWENKILKMLI